MNLQHFYKIKIENFFLKIIYPKNNYFLFLKIVFKNTQLAKHLYFYKMLKNNCFFCSLIFKQFLKTTWTSPWKTYCSQVEFDLLFIWVWSPGQVRHAWKPYCPQASYMLLDDLLLPSSAVDGFSLSPQILPLEVLMRLFA